MKQLDTKDDQGSLRRRLLSDGSSPPPQLNYSNRRRGFGYFIVPMILVSALLIGVGILAYSFGITRGKASANAERDILYESRQRSWNATATAQADTLPTREPGTGSRPGFNQGSSTYARIDKIEDDKITVLLLNTTGAPTGTTLVINLTQQAQIWRNAAGQPTDLKAGDSILFVGERNEGGNYDARNILILPIDS